MLLVAFTIETKTVQLLAPLEYKALVDKMQTHWEMTDETDQDYFDALAFSRFIEETDTDTEKEYQDLIDMIKKCHGLDVSLNYIYGNGLTDKETGEVLDDGSCWAVYNVVAITPEAKKIRDMISIEVFEEN